jgi:molybdenum cofactor biosynthesis enzyme MoaA
VEFANWMEVMLLPECNGSCAWCVEKGGFRPNHRATWCKMVEAMKLSGKRNIMLLGGEPTLHPNLWEIIDGAARSGLRVHMTTNGSRLNRKFVQRNLVSLTGLNVSIMSDDLEKSRRETGISLCEGDLREAVGALTERGVRVRFNCNLLKGCIDSKAGVHRYVKWARAMGASEVRLAEMKGYEDRFVDLFDLFGNRWGLNRDPFTEGC